MAAPPKPSEREQAKALREAEAKAALHEHAQRAEAEQAKTVRLRALRLARDAEVERQNTAVQKRTAAGKATKPSRKRAPKAAE